MQRSFVLNKSTFFSDRFPSVNCTRYAVMFSFENIYGLFRLNGNTQYSDSRSYDLILCDFHNNISPEDVLIDLFLLSSTGKINIDK